MQILYNKTVVLNEMLHQLQVQHFCIFPQYAHGHGLMKPTEITLPEKKAKRDAILNH